MIRKFIVIAAILGAVSACGSPGSASENDGSDKATVRLHADRAKEYQSIQELKNDSSMVVKAIAGEATVENLNGIPVTITKVAISRTQWGKAPAKSLSVLQFGSNAVISEDFAQILKKGSEYILFLKPMHFVPGDDTGRYLITGSQGAYLLDGHRADYRFIGGGTPKLPASIPYGDAESADFLAK